MFRNTIVVCLLLVTLCHADDPLKNNSRPPPNQRLFVSSAVENTLQQIVPKMKDEELALLFVNCFPNTLDTTVFYNKSIDPLDTFVITGDIPAMWLRDSSGQVFPYLQLAPNDPELQAMIKGLIERQAKSINIDPYANAFNKGPGLSPWDNDVRSPPMSVYLWEGKYEVDSLGWPMKLWTTYYNITQDDSMCTPAWFSAVRNIISVFQYQQQEVDDMKPGDPLYYSFGRTTQTQSETLLAGVGAPSKKCGLVRGGFRPSDDAHRLPYQIAGNALAGVALNDISNILGSSSKCTDISLAIMAKDVAQKMLRAISNGIIQHPSLGSVYAYEIDGYGSNLFMDDATIPNLLSLPYVGLLPPNDPVYLNTRRNLLLSMNNPYYFCGSLGCGIGSPHTGRGKIWPMAILMQALTSQDPNEITQCLNLLKTTTAGKNFMHESFNVNDATDFTRSWFAWANTLYGELILKVAKEFPSIIFG